MKCALGVDVAADRRQSLGRIGEDLACRELDQRGYVILARRYRTRHGEIDIVARDGDALVFVEVKTRQGLEFGGAGAAVTMMKQRRIVRMATDYLARMRINEAACRFDVVAIEFEGAHPRIDVFRHAFTA